MRSYATASVRSLLFVGSALLAAACGDDDPVVERDLDGGKPDGSIDAAVDGGKPDDRDGGNADARVDPKSDASIDASVSCTLGQRYRYEGIGGLVAYSDHRELTAEGEYRRVRTAVRDVDAGTLSCAVALPACGGSTIDADDLAAALTDPGVVAAFGDGVKVYGYDARPVDGQVLSVERQDGKKISIGSACDGHTGCEAIPAPLASLQRLLGELDEQQSRTVACAAFR